MTVELTWDAVPADKQNEDETSQSGSSSQPGNGYTNPYDIFDYFFGNRYGN